MGDDRKLQVETGTRVSRTSGGVVRFGTVVDILPAGGALVRWDEAHGGEPGTVATISEADGWRVEKRQYRVAWTLVLEADDEDALTRLLGEMLRPAAMGALMWHDEVVVDVSGEMTSSDPEWLRRLRGDAG